MKRIIVNLAPADTKKEGPIYDLPILLGLLAASGQISLPPENTAFFGELSLSGELRPAVGALPMAAALKAAGISTLYVPFDNAAEAALVEGIVIYAARHASELIDHLEGKRPLSPVTRNVRPPSKRRLPDFADVKGQDGVKRALEIASAGSQTCFWSALPDREKACLPDACRRYCRPSRTKRPLNPQKSIRWQASSPGMNRF